MQLREQIVANLANQVYRNKKQMYYCKLYHIIPLQLLLPSMWCALLMFSLSALIKLIRSQIPVKRIEQILQQFFSH